MTKIISLLVLAVFGAAVLAFGPQEEPTPAASDVKPPEALPIKQKNGNIKLGEITLDNRKKEISFKGTLNSPDQGVLEVLISTPRGRVHEALVVTKASPYQLEYMLYLLGADTEVKRKAKGKKGSLVNIDLEWQDDNGVLHREPIEQWVEDERTKKAMRRQGFYFCGSNIENKVYQAEGHGNLCLLYSNTPATVLDCADKDSSSDILYTTNSRKHQPGASRDVRVIISLKKER